MEDQELLSLRLAVIERIVSTCSDTGKTKVQKIAYFLQESVGVPLKFPFRMHYFGPYSDRLDSVLSLAKALGAVDISPDPEGFGYHVTPGTVNGSTWSQAYDIAKDPKIEEIDKAVRDLGVLETYKLELYATIHFISGIDKKQSKQDVLETVSGLKPKFNKDVLDNAYQTLQGAGLI